MRFMIIVKSQPDFEAETAPVKAPDEKLYAAMAQYHEDLVKAGALLDASGLQPSSKGWRIHYSESGKRTLTDGPFAEAKELIAGYTVIQVRSREEAMEWARRFPNPAGEGKEAVIEVRQLWEMEDFPAGDTTDRFKQMGMK
ncbi:MAG: YciI family protein [Burkholderiales bacterium]|nr:YciI family protein [Burkholderiales bacterium]